MAAKPRRKWQLRYRTTAAVDTFPSQRKAYEFIGDLARAYHAEPDTTDPRVYVFVDERDGRGWQSYEDVMLTEVEPAGSAATNTEEG